MLPAHSRSQPYQTPANDEPRISGREVGSAGLAAPDSVDNCADSGGGATGSVDGLDWSEAPAAIAGRPVGAAGVRWPPIRRAGGTGDLAGPFWASREWI